MEDGEIIPGENYFEWNVRPPDGATPEQIDFYASIRDLLEPYEPANTLKESTDQFSTAEIMSALERHYGVPQGDPDHTAIDGKAIVDYLKENGWKCLNTGGLQLEWIMVKKKQ